MLKSAVASRLKKQIDGPCMSLREHMRSQGWSSSRNLTGRIDTAHRRILDLSIPVWQVEGRFNRNEGASQAARAIENQLLAGRRDAGLASAQ